MEGRVVAISFFYQPFTAGWNQGEENIIYLDLIVFGCRLFNPSSNANVLIEKWVISESILKSAKLWMQQ